MSSRSLEDKLTVVNKKLDKIQELVEKEDKYLLQFHINPIIVILVIFVLALSFDFFSEAIHGFINRYLPEHFNSEWWFFTLLAIGVLLLLFIIIKVFHIPVTAIEKLP